MKHKKLDGCYERLDGKSLNTFLKVFECGSVSAAAKRLGVSQSNVSYVLENLRSILGDELFVRTKQGVLPTSFSLAIHKQVYEIFEGMRKLASPNIFIPEDADCILRLGIPSSISNIIVPSFYRTISQQINSLDLVVNTASVEIEQDLRTSRFDLCLTEFPDVKSDDIIQKHIAESHLVCFFDSTVRDNPQHLETLKAAHYVGINYHGNNPPSDMLTGSYQLPFDRYFELYVQDFFALQSLVQGTDRLAVAQKLLASHALAGLSYVDLPFELNPIPIYMLWHKRHQDNLQHKWLRNQMKTIVQNLL